jgi:Family of unknown function (DUF6152)
MKISRSNGRLSGVLCAALLLAMTGVALAHHSTANFDRTKEQTITGTVTYFGFTNPHSFFDLDVVDATTGKTEPFKVFTAGRVLLVRYDWKSEDMKAGDKVTVTGYPDRKDPHFMYLSRVVFASGKVWERGQIPD